MGDDLVGCTSYTTPKGMLRVTTTISIKSVTMAGTHSYYVSSGIEFRGLTSGQNLVFLRLLLSIIRDLMQQYGKIVVLVKT